MLLIFSEICSFLGPLNDFVSGQESKSPLLTREDQLLARNIERLFLRSWSWAVETRA